MVVVDVYAWAAWFASLEDSRRTAAVGLGPQYGSPVGGIRTNLQHLDEAFRACHATGAAAAMKAPLMNDAVGVVVAAVVVDAIAD